MDLSTKIKPVSDRCIYCGDLPKSGASLGGEHIIAEVFGGKWELLEASCRCCEIITGSLEKQAGDHMTTPVREHLGLRGRGQKRPRRQMPVVVSKEGQKKTIYVPVKDHPGTMLTWAFDLATSITGEPLSDGIAARVVIRTLHPDFWRRASLVDGQVNLIDRRPVAPAALARVLAKTAHSYAMAKYGPNSFAPLLREVILGQNPFYPS